MLFGCFLKCLLDIIEDVFRVFDAYGEADKIRGDAGFL